MTEKLEPPVAAIKAGYNMMKAREAIDEGNYGMGYVTTAIHCVREAIPQIVEETGLEYHQPAKGLKLLYESAEALAYPMTNVYGILAAGQRIGEAHNYFSRMMRRQGYRPITNADFEALGSGGGR